MLWMPIISFRVIRAIVNTCFSLYWQNSSIVGKLFELIRSSFHLLIFFVYFFQLSRDDIESMREQGVEGSKIIGELIENSASFSQKTR
jgi:hypothetical protein